jgi:hypothetical protein
MTKKTKLKCCSGEVMTVHINLEVVFRCALILANSRDDVTVEKILSFPIGPVPTSNKACKADLCHQFESEAPIRHFLR